MSIGLRLDLRQTQQLVMTPQLQQAIKLLAMSNLELTDFIAAEVEKNPLLEIASTDEAPAEPLTPRTGEPTPADARTDDHGLAAETFDTGTENLHDTAPSDGPSPIGETRSAVRSAPADAVDLEDRLSGLPSLRDHLLGQIGQMPFEGPVDLIARYLVDELDEHGYLRTDLDEIADRVGATPAQAEAALAALQTCEPTGVAARNLAECLGLQLAERDRLDPAMQALLTHLDLLPAGEVKRLRQICGVDAEDFSGMVAELRALDPRPCAAFDIEEAQTLVPDLIARPNAWGGWSLELNADTLPNVLIDRTYRASISANGDDDARQYLSDCHANASWLVKSLDQRARTILKVGTEIVRRQERFMTDGITGLQPLTLRVIADAIGMHESTVSRVTRNKYMATHRGIFELKFFFTNSVGGEDDIAASAVRHRIKSMVQDEVAGAVLSDDAIVDALKSEGIDIARRTVAKYRKSLNIPSSVERRRLLALKQQT